MAQPKSAKSAATRARIIAAAISVLNGKNYQECVIDDIAAAAGTAKGTVYLYFKSKEELYYSILFELIAGMRELVAEVDHATLACGAQMRLLVHRMFDFIQERGHLMMVMREETRRGSGKLHARLLAELDAFKNELARLVERGIAAKKFKRLPPHFVSAFLFVLISAVAGMKAKQKPGAAEITPEMIGDMFMTGIEITHTGKK